MSYYFNVHKNVKITMMEDFGRLDIFTKSSKIVKYEIHNGLKDSWGKNSYQVLRLKFYLRHS